MEQAIRRLSKVYGFSFSIMRVGPLGPAKAGEDGLVLEASDTLTVVGLESKLHHTWVVSMPLWVAGSGGGARA